MTQPAGILLPLEAPSYFAERTRANRRAGFRVVRPCRQSDFNFRRSKHTRRSAPEKLPQSPCGSRPRLSLEHAAAGLHSPGTGKTGTRAAGSQRDESHYLSTAGRPRGPSHVLYRQTGTPRISSSCKRLSAPETARPENPPSVLPATLGAMIVHEENLLRGETGKLGCLPKDPFVRLHGMYLKAGTAHGEKLHQAAVPAMDVVPMHFAGVRENTNGKSNGSKPADDRNHRYIQPEYVAGGFQQFLSGRAFAPLVRRISRKILRSISVPVHNRAEGPLRKALGGFAPVPLRSPLRFARHIRATSKCTNTLPRSK